MASSDNLEEIKGELLRFLLTDDYGVGEAQMKLERLIQCSNIPRHAQGQAKEAVKEMIRDSDVPVYSKGGGGRDVVQLVPGELDQAKRLCNAWHPDRKQGESFDRTDLSGRDWDERAFSIPYDHKGTVWHRLEQTEAVNFDSEHGSVVPGVDADRLLFVVEGPSDTVSTLVNSLIDDTSGDLARHPELYEQVEAEALLA